MFLICIIYSAAECDKEFFTSFRVRVLWTGSLMYNHIIKKNDFPIKSFIYESVVELQILENYGRKKMDKKVRRHRVNIRNRLYDSLMNLISATLMCLINEFLHTDCLQRKWGQHGSIKALRDVINPADEEEKTTPCWSCIHIEM